MFKNPSSWSFFSTYFKFNWQNTITKLAQMLN